MLQYIHMKTTIPQFTKLNQKAWVKQLLKEFKKAEIFIVGGALRDALLQRPVGDLDIVIRNVSKTNLQKFLSANGEVKLVGKRFGVYKFKPKNHKGGAIDIALPRTENSINLSGAYKDFQIKSDARLPIETDLGRRDFTINAMAYNITTKELVDPFNGQRDLKKKAIMTVGRPAERFTEDYSRMLRALRFATQLEFEIEVNTWNEIEKSCSKINKVADGQRIVPLEVIAQELNKMIIANPVTAIGRLDASGLLKQLMPELLDMKNCQQPAAYHSEGDVWVHTVLALQQLSSTKFKKEFPQQQPTDEVIWALILHDIGKPPTYQKTDRIRFNNHDIVSAKMARKIMDRLKIAAAGVDTHAVEYLCAKHMLLASGAATTMKETTLEKYFFSDTVPGQEMLMVMFADISASLDASGKPNFTDYKKLKQRIAKLAKKVPGKKRLPRALITGYDIQKEFKLSPGKKIGDLLEISREAQLKGKISNKKQALSLIKKHI